MKPFISIHKLSFFISLFCAPVSFLAQDNTRTADVISNDSIEKIMLVPFEPKLYMSDIDRKVNEETNWNFNQIREYFRHELNTQIQFKLKKIAPVISFYTDSLKRAKDLKYIYESTTLSYDLVEPNTNSSQSTAKQKGIKNGQIVVEINTDKKFMNKKILDPKLITYLHKKYNTNYFVFINELDFQTNMESYNISTDSYQRTVSVHYSIIDKDSKTIKAGIIHSTFSSKQNNPKKIVSQNFTAKANNISSQFSSIITH